MKSGFPKYLSIQTTSLCNGRCIFCPYEQIKDLFPKKIMDMQLYRKIIDECADYRTVERAILYLNNEPLTDPHMVERINYAKDKLPWASVHILTNGSLLNDDLADRLIDSNLDWIGFSLHGIKKDTLEKAMGLDYDLTYKQVLKFIDKAKAKREIRDFILVTFLNHKYLSAEEREEAIKFWKSKGIERISCFDSPVSRAGNVRDLSIPPHKKVAGCASIWADDMMHIVETGDVILCCMDWQREVNLGNARDKSIYEIWNSPAYSAIRGMRDGTEESGDDFICKRCESAILEPRREIKAGSANDILLVICPPWGIETPPLGIASISVYLRSRGIKAEIFDFNIRLYNAVEKEYKHLWEMGSAIYWRDKEKFCRIRGIFKPEIEYCVDRIIHADAGVVGFSVLSSPQDRITLEVIKGIKQKKPGLKVLLGGTSVSVDAQRAFFEKEAGDLIEAYIIGEGEEVVYDLLHNIRAGNPLDSVQGALINRKDKYVYAPRLLKENLDGFLPPDFAEFNLNHYANNRDGLIMEWSRGCINNCSFCAFNAISSKFRKKNPEAIIKAIKDYKTKYDTKHLLLVDPAINGDLGHLEDICDLLIKENLDIQFSALAIPRKGMDERLLRKMRQAGFIRVEYGIESGSDKILKKMRKNYNSSDAENAIIATHLAGIETIIYLIIGFPGEGDAEFAQTVDFVRRNAKYIDCVKSANPLYLMAGSDIYKNHMKYGIALPEINADFRWSIPGENTYEMRLERVNKIRATFKKSGVKYFSEDNMFEREDASAEKCLSGRKTVEADITLVTLPPWGIENPPIGLAYLDEYLRSKGLRTKILDFNIYFHNTINADYKMLWHVENKNYWSNEGTFALLLGVFNSQIAHAVNKILAADSDLIGFSVVDPKERLTIEVIKRIKTMAPSKKIVLGGPACSTEEQRDFFIKGMPEGYVDYFVVGEGEATLCEIIQKEKQGLTGERLPGLAIKANGKWDFTPREPITPLDDIPSPAYENFDLAQYNGGKSMLLEWSRGCRGKCSFCKNYRLSGNYRARNPLSIIKELEYIVGKYGIRQFTICDNLMNGDIRQVSEVSDRIIQKGMHIEWSGQIAPRKEMGNDLFRRMYAAGCHKIQIGVESGSNKILHRMKKIYTAEIAQANIREAKKSGMSVEIFILVGFPGEGAKEFKETREFIRRNAQYIDAIKSINTLHLIAGTDIYENFHDYNLKNLPEKDWHYKWETYDGNTYVLRKKRVEDLMDLAAHNGLKVIEVNIREGKEKKNMGFAGKGIAEQLESLKINIKLLQEFPRGIQRSGAPRRGRISNFILLVFIFLYTLFYIFYFWLFKKLKGRLILGG